MPETSKDWTSAIIWVIGLVFVCGMTYRNIEAVDAKTTINARDIRINTDDVKQNRESIHAEALARTKMIGTIIATKEDTEELKGGYEKLQEDFDELKIYLMQYDYGKKRIN